jgi:GT2 family glycosyltransferase
MKADALDQLGLDQPGAGPFRPGVSVVIKTYDDSAVAARGSFPTLPELLMDTLRALETQTLPPQEVLVVDSSPGDGIARVIERYASTSPPGGELTIRHMRMDWASFSYPRALNLGVQAAQCEVVVSLSGDATPANGEWLEKLVAPLRDPQVAGAFSRQVARPGSRLVWAERFRLWWRYRSQATAVRRADPIFSNASSAFRWDLAVRFPFDESLAELEDYAWARTMQREGYGIAYVGESQVYHSHRRSSLRTLWRMAYYVYLRMRIDARKSGG